MDADSTRISKDELVDGWCWRFASEQDKHYHDTEWGVPVHDDMHMFEHLSLECLQCGLSWNYILKRRDVFRRAFCNFDIDAVAAFNDENIQRMMEIPGMLRSSRKLAAVVNNAQCAQRIRQEFGSFAAYFWAWTEGVTLCYEGHDAGGLPAHNGLSRRMAADLKARGFKYVGPTNIYAHLQACGIVCDHNKKCVRYGYVMKNYPCKHVPRDGETLE